MLLGKYLIFGKMSKCSQMTECQQHSLNYQGHHTQIPRVQASSFLKPRLPQDLKGLSLQIALLCFHFQM